MDRRQQKTRQAIFEAFTELLSEKNYSRITVQNIIEKANIGRSTFYDHFETRDDLIKTMCGDLFTHVFSKVLPREKTHDFSLSGRGCHTVTVHLLYHLRDSRKYTGVLLTCGNSLFMEYLKQCLRKFITNYILPSLTQKSTELPESFLINHITYSFIGLLLWWHHNNWQNSPEEMAAYFEKTILPLGRK